MHHVKTCHHFEGRVWKVQRSGEPMRGIYWPSDELKLDGALRANYLFDRDILCKTWVDTLSKYPLTSQRFRAHRQVLLTGQLHRQSSPKPISSRHSPLITYPTHRGEFQQPSHRDNNQIINREHRAHICHRILLRRRCCRHGLVTSCSNFVDWSFSVTYDGTSVLVGAGSHKCRALQPWKASDFTQRVQGVHAGCRSRQSGEA